MGGFKRSHPAKKKGKKIQHHRLNIRNVHHTRSLSQHTRHNRAVFTPFPARVHAAVFALSAARGGHPFGRRICWSKKEKEGWGRGVERTSTATMVALHPGLFLFKCHMVEF